MTAFVLSSITEMAAGVTSALVLTLAIAFDIVRGTQS